MVGSLAEVREETERGQHFAVIGGGFIGSEIAAALATNDKHVTMIQGSPGLFLVAQLEQRTIAI